MENQDLIQRISIANKARQELGNKTVLWYALYQLGLRTGRWKRLTPVRSPVESQRVAVRLQEIAMSPPQPVLAKSNPEIVRIVLHGNEGLLLKQADEIADGLFRRYGADPVALDLSPHTPLVHWSEAERLVESDIKDVWEPARFGWAFTLARAYHLSADERYSRAFWEHFGVFRSLNPYNLGVNWASGQEVALRILALSFAWRMFHGSPESSEAQCLALVQSIYEHAARIPPTMIYAQSQKNNHVITEALGLYTAGWVLQGAPEASAWLQRGQSVLNEALDEQIAEDGTYIQHSMNYHRLMLQAALWGHTLNRRTGTAYPPHVKEKLAAATRWLLAQIDPLSGSAPNLGANDGALILPLSTCSFQDYRPVAQSSAVAFLGKSTSPEGCWDESSLWLGLQLNQYDDTLTRVSSPGVLRLGDGASWATLRAADFTHRPSQADQLHVDLWWRGENIALDAGTFRYNAPAPWDNALAATAVHNTVQIDGYDQMERAGRFLWLNWAQSKILMKGSWHTQKVTAEHNGYRFLNLVHRRSLTKVSMQHWQVEDIIEHIQPEHREHQIRLHWLVPDWPFEVAQGTVTLQMKSDRLMLGLGAFTKDSVQIPTGDHLQIFREGKSIYGTKENQETLGYHSPTYSVLQPALSIVFTIRETPPVRIISAWSFSSRDDR